MPMVVGFLGAAVIAAVVVATQVWAARRTRARADAASVAMLAPAAATLGLDAPRLVARPLVRWACRGTMRGLDAELGAVVTWASASVAVVVDGLPGGTQISPRPTGRDVEDYYTGAAVPAGDDRFDAHYCLRAKKDLSCSLADAAKTVPRGLLDLAIDRFDAAYEVEIGAAEVIVRPAWERSREPSQDLVALWRYAETFVATGIERGLMRK